MALKVSEVIDLIEPNYGDGNPTTFYRSVVGDYWIAGEKQRNNVLNPDDFKKSLFIAPFTKTDDSEHYSIYKDKFELGEKTEENEKKFQFISASSCLYKHSGSIESFVFTNEIFTKIIEVDKIVSLIDLAVQKGKLKELIKAVVEIDNKPETQDKLLPKIIKASDDTEKLKDLIETAVIAGKLKELIEAVVEIDNIQENLENTETQDKLLPKLIEAAVTARKFRNLIEAVVGIDNIQVNSENPETQDKLLPKIIEKRDQLINADSRSYINYKQLIIYGPAGVGKTFSIKKLVSNNLENDGLNISEENFEKQTIHTVFHPEYSYYDFFGKVMPIKDENQISYDFLPGPFAQALSKAYKNITNQPINPEKVILVVDELNRGNAASIFGGLFNLLDRNNNGISEYPLNIYGMEAMWLKEQIGDSDLSTLEKYSKKTNFEMYDGENKSLKIFIPDNLSIICTMNTSDQTIFSLDKAFQRRFNKNFITAEKSIDSYPTYNNNEIEIQDKHITWKDFLKKLNKFIVDHAEVEDVDNATIGAFFVKPKDGFILAEDIKYTVMYYLWYDLFSGYRRDTLKEELDKLDKLYKLYKLGDEFKNVNTFEQFVGKYNKFITIFTQK